LIQANFVAARLREYEPTLEVELLEVATRGDIDQSASLVRPAGRDGEPGKGVFIDSLRDALVDGRADLAAHSMKDVPVAPAQGLALTTFGPRADPRDALVTRPGIRDLYDLAPSAKVATVSIRRRALLKSVLRDVEVVPVRGNVGTRLMRLDEGRCDALLLASAGLDRLGLDGRITQRLATDTFVPAPGQGALAVEYIATRSDMQIWKRPRPWQKALVKPPNSLPSTHWVRCRTWSQAALPQGNSASRSATTLSIQVRRNSVGSSGTSAGSNPSKSRTGTGDGRDPKEPSPSWPKPLAPQHDTEPSASMAQACPSPARDAVLTVTATARVIPRRRAGAARGSVVPSSGWPAALLTPQHDTPPSRCRAQTLRSPTETARASLMPATTWGRTASANRRC